MNTKTAMRCKRLTGNSGSVEVQKIFRGGAGKIHSLKYQFQMIGTGYSYHPALFL
ncbi:MAG: hypothetical protein MR404_07260 [Prevotellaceae bacterium]|nr:hypothetical protein [Prevotellaceae bacterium]MDY3295182.1 hypothetical protein [Bacteroidaceae bacterium]